MEHRTSSDSEVMADLWGYDPTRRFPGGGSGGPGERSGSGGSGPGEAPEETYPPELASDASSSSVEDGFSCANACGCSTGSDDGEAERCKARGFGQGSYGCTHYRRRCLIVAPCCGEVFWCRHCHNEAKCANEKVSASLLNPRLSCSCACLSERIPTALPSALLSAHSHTCVLCVYSYPVFHYSAHT